jgi:3,4-dihydroxy 2-butanone 4-phosphate synthase/GTP cyclohydrolase II
VRLAAGKSPQPVVVDGRLRFPLSARLLRAPCVPPIIATTAEACRAREAALREAGAQVVRLPSLPGCLVNIGSLLAHLYEGGIRSLMVEGGGRVITNFMASGLVDLLVITVVPQVVGGLPAVQPFSRGAHSSTCGGLTNVQYHAFAGDLVVCADMEKPAVNCHNCASSHLQATR